MARQQNGVVNLKGKNYKTVAKRVEDFRAMFPASEGWAIVSKILVADNDHVLIEAQIKNPQGVVIGTGHAEEVRGSSNVNSTSAVENCETSAVGRALGFIGLQGEELASFDEVINAMLQRGEIRIDDDTSTNGQGPHSTPAPPANGKNNGQELLDNLKGTGNLKPASDVKPPTTSKQWNNFWRTCQDLARRRSDLFPSPHDAIKKCATVFRSQGFERSNDAQACQDQEVFDQALQYLEGIIQDAHPATADAGAV